MTHWVLSLAYAIPFALLASWFLRRRSARQAEADRVWRLFAELRGLRRLDPQLHRYEGLNEGMPFSLDLVWDGTTRQYLGGRLTSSHGRQRRLWTRMGLFLPGLPSGFHLAPLTWRTRLFAGLTGRRIETGDAAFDSCFLAQGAVESQVRDYLQPQRRARLLQLRSALGTVSIEGDWLRFRRRQWTRRRSDLESAYAVMGAAAHELAAGPLGAVTPFEPEDGPCSEPYRMAAGIPLWVPVAVVAALAFFLGSQLADLHEGGYSRPATRRAAPGATAVEASLAVDLWELHPDDRVRFVTLAHGSAGVRWNAGSPFLAPGSRIVSELPIEASLSSRTDARSQYRGREYVHRVYSLVSTSETSGIEIVVDDLPHLRSQGSDMRLLSVGVDPQKRRRRRIACVAIPAGSDPVEVTDFQPFQQTDIGDWRLLLYDTTALDSHVSIHVRYRPGPDATPLDWRILDRLAAAGRSPVERDLRAPDRALSTP